MGLFSSTKIPQPPLPDIAIHLYCSIDHIFRPNELVSGQVSFTPVAPIAPHALVVSLFGQSLIWHRTSQTDSNHSTDYYHWRDNAPLFEVVKNVLPPWDPKAPALAVGQSYTYPFSFRFRTGTSNTRLGQYKEDADELWTVGPHELPPTFLSASKHSKVDQPYYAKVEYGIRARLVCPGIGVVKGKNLKDFVTTAPVFFAPMTPISQSLDFSADAVRHAQSFILQSSALTGQSSNAIGF